MSEVKLLPCPFCSHEACMDGDPGSWGYYPATAFVRCGKCNARGPTFHDDEGGSRNYRAEAATAWNRRADVARANMEPLIAENERLRAEVETLRDGLDYLRQMQGAPDVLELRAKAARSERLAEALRVAVDLVDSDVIRVGPYPSDREELIAALTQWNAALDQEGGNG